MNTYYGKSFIGNKSNANITDYLDIMAEGRVESKQLQDFKKNWLIITKIDSKLL